MIHHNSPRATIEQYVDNVLSGDVVSCKAVMAACQRFVDDMQKASDGWQYYFDWELADRACRFFSKLRHTTGAYAGKPFDLYPFQQFIIGNVFGWLRHDNQRRRFRVVYFSVGRGGGKSPLSAGITIRGFACDEPREDRAECYVVATKRDQARIIFEECKRFVERSPGMSDFIEVLKHSLSIPSNYSSVVPISSEGKTADGQIPHIIALDELHAWGQEHRTLIDKLETGFAKREQPLLIVTTTAGDENSEIWHEYYTLCKHVLDRNADIACDHIFVFIAEIDEEDSELDIDALAKANPLMEYGVVKREVILGKIQEAKVDPGKRLQLRRYYGNRLTISRTKSITPERWDKGDQPIPDLDGMECFAAVDLGWKDDLAAIGYCFPLEKFIDGKRCYVIEADVWIPKHTKVRDITRDPWRKWIDDGWLRVTDSEWTDTGAMYLRMEERMQTQGIVQVAYDPSNATEFAVNIVNQVGIRRTFPFSQSHAKYNEPFNEFLIGLDEGRIIHGGNPLLRWCAMNVVEVQNSQMLRRPDKGRSQDKIDPIVAIIMALQGSMYDDLQRGISYYESHEVEIM